MPAPETPTSAVLLPGASERAERLAKFTASVEAASDALSAGLVTDNKGETPIVTALGDELLTTLVARVRDTGGYANVFVLSPSGMVRQVSVVRSECAIGEAHDDLTDDDRPGDTALVDTFIDYLALHEGSVKLDAEAGSRARDARIIDDLTPA